MDATVELVGKILRPGGHGFIFCTVQQLPKWEHRLKAVQLRYVIAENEEEEEELMKTSGPAFMVENKPLNQPDQLT